MKRSSPAWRAGEEIGLQTNARACVKDRKKREETIAIKTFPQ